jgi:hypothetical protein
MTAPTQPPARPPAQRELRPWTDFDRLTKPRPEDRVLAGSAVLLALVFHAMMFAWVLPWLDKEVHEPRLTGYTTAKTPAQPVPSVEYTLTPATKEDLEAMRYVEANPNAPVAKPDATKNISNRDQRVAQPVPNPNGHSDLPTTDGKQATSVKIVPGVPNPQPVPAAAAPSPSRPAEQTPAPAPTPATAPPVVVAANQPSFLDKNTPPEGEGIRLADKTSNTTTTAKPDDLPPTVDQQQNQRPLPPGPLTPEIVASRAAAATPETRLDASAKTHEGPLIINIEGTHVGGVAPALDSRLTPFGEYLSLMYNAIASAWTVRCREFDFSPRDWGTQVEVSFTLNAQGEIEDVQVDRSTASRSATLLCVNAIKTPAPYAKWTSDMLALLGQHYTMHITFYYE